MDLEQIQNHIAQYHEYGQTTDAAEYVLRAFGLEQENFGGFLLREISEDNMLILTTEGSEKGIQQVRIPENLFKFDFLQAVNLIAHEMVHVRQRTGELWSEDRNEREFQAYYENLFHEIFPLVPDAPTSSRIVFAEKALKYYRQMGENTLLQERYKAQKERIQILLKNLQS